ncbi:MAG: TolC family protein [Bacteroidales bacterium]
MRINNSLFRLLASAIGMVLVGQTVAQQTLSLREALEIGVDNYETIKAKRLNLGAAQADHRASKTLYMPEISISAQQYFGTANALHGPQYAFGEGNISMGAPQESQNWDAAFSSLYSANLNWNLYSFGSRAGRVNLSKSKIERAQAELEQELFEHQIKIASSYLDLVAIEEILKVQNKSLERSKVILSSVGALVQSGMRPAVELATAQAEVAAAEISLLKALDQRSLVMKELVLRMGVEYQLFTTDGSLAIRLPEDIPSEMDIYTHPALRTQDAHILESHSQTRAFNGDALPKINLVASLAGRGSGFMHNYAQDKSMISSSYLDGVGIDRGNYLVGINLSWSITSLFKNRALSRAQKQRTLSLNHHRELTNQQLTESFRYATQKRMLTQQQYQAVIKQVDAANQSFQQYDNLYGNGLAVVDDLITSLYNLTRAESERAIIKVNLWHAYLMQVASSGDIELFFNQL